MARWTLFALGTVEGERIRLPTDPVAAWLLRRSPDLMPPQAVGSVLTMIRARTSIIDRMIEEEVRWSVENDEGLDYWSVAGGFDARWYRIKTLMSEAVRKHFEVESPELLEVKAALLSESSFRTSWRAIERRAMPEDGWTVQTRGHGNLVVLEGASTRLPPRKLRDLLRRIRSDAPNARVILDLPSFVSMLHSKAALPRDAAGAEIEGKEEVDNPYRWSRNFLRRLGWEVREDLWLTSRPMLESTGLGLPELPGMEALRIVRLRATPDREQMRTGVASISLGPRN
ncbi:MAG: class I SAM-dependent methyltransferase [Myxococcales bacterium]|nr:class I SAM-dependent methyltransferase [Myxococcales bacterium]MCB9669918.1 class I SAM-dependent methyltransferase [Alphaproteobacteria bacterium]MCB9693208.1 class I SAM-dependent methyltransferase [Alphaproteobacteria bacterium]